MKSLHFLSSIKGQDPVVNLFPEPSGTRNDTQKHTLFLYVDGVAVGELKKILTRGTLLQDPSMYGIPAGWKWSSFPIELDCLEKC